MSSAPDKEIEFASSIRRALDESTAGLPAATLDRLAVARRLALARKKPEPATAPAFAPVLAHAGAAPDAPLRGGGERRLSPLGRLLRVWPVVALVGGVALIAYWENAQRAAELADIDAAMLNDDLPLNAYLDHGFNAYLSRAR
ncbi:DUF3619 family protein [Trinickia soli]|uniref:DUF3619 domain-containing protein n=1 Tax=Trinickia soli TaxID=380675 RepID=A0A2N7VRX2_9BURK|nr:DUF3619 family protein [Trinickia soli]KAA0090095.1 DUF3619 family protein [Paraburkholderia sp. T12-10]PMS19908.1 DUF3619 domain-containing protein [Trinickia soli]CAB3685886.1 hypothetical protein LMG24076_02682 [Trinickia soli]